MFYRWALIATGMVLGAAGGLAWEIARHAPPATVAVVCVMWGVAGAGVGRLGWQAARAVPGDATEPMDAIEDDDGHVIDLLVDLFADCRARGIWIPPDLPLDTPGNRRAAAGYLGHLLATGSEPEG